MWDPISPSFQSHGARQRATKVTTNSLVAESCSRDCYMPWDSGGNTAWRDNSNQLTALNRTGNKTCRLSLMIAYTVQFHSIGLLQYSSPFLFKHRWFLINFSWHVTLNCTHCMHYPFQIFWGKDTLEQTSFQLCINGATRNTYTLKSLVTWVYASGMPDFILLFPCV